MAQKNNLDGIYDKEKLNSDDLESFILKMKSFQINGANVTVPFKKEIIPFLDKLTLEAKATQSVNTIYLREKKIVGHNTDIEGFEFALRDTKFDLNGKTIFIIGAGGVVPSIIFTLNKMKASKILITNRTKNKADILKDLFRNLSIVEWGEVPKFDMVINATSLGLNEKDEINLDFSKAGNEKFFYDVIYNPKETNFLKKAKILQNKTENEKKCLFIAAAAFNIWHNIYPKIDDEIYKLLD